MSKTEWIAGSEPGDVGWYAISYCWDIQEGIISGAAHWDGEKWSRELPIGHYFGVFADEEAAEKWAYDNAIEA
jgi:hypothetical protein